MNSAELESSMALSTTDREVPDDQILTVAIRDTLSIG